MFCFPFRLLRLLSLGLRLLRLLRFGLNFNHLPPKNLARRGTYERSRSKTRAPKNHGDEVLLDYEHLRMGDGELKKTATESSAHPRRSASVANNGVILNTASISKVICLTDISESIPFVTNQKISLSLSVFNDHMVTTIRSSKKRRVSMTTSSAISEGRICVCCFW